VKNKIFKLCLYDDDSVTFENVITGLTTVLGWSVYQSEQIALIVHYNGKALVKKDTLEELQPIEKELMSYGLTVKIIEK